jgi:hypothetical protein
VQPNFDHVDISLLATTALTAVAWIVFEIRHRGAFEIKNGPMPLKIRHLFMWISLVEIAAITFWRTQHGTYIY